MMLFGMFNHKATLQEQRNNHLRHDLISQTSIMEALSSEVFEGQIRVRGNEQVVHTFTSAYSVVHKVSKQTEKQ